MNICLGLQSLNVAAGGTLTQDIPSEIYGLKTYEQVMAQDESLRHRNPHFFVEPSKGVSPFSLHTIVLSKDPMWDGFFQKPSDAEQLVVPSAHHQAIKKLGAKLKVIARSRDKKIIEAVRHTAFRRVFGVQFHPEYRFVWDPSIEARLHREHPTKNYFTHTLQNNPASQRFHRRLWEMFSDWVAQSSQTK